VWICIFYLFLLFDCLASIFLKTLEQIKQETDFNTNKNIPEAPVWVDDALAQINRNPLNKFRDQLDATANIALYFDWQYFTEYNRKIATSYHTQPNFLPKQKNSSGN
jgi:hypothetical protein